jgi:nucleoside-diphosphate-sugar epimerase
MRVVVTGATGNHGSSLVRRLSRDPEVERITGLARRLPKLALPKVSWTSVDIAQDPLEEVFAGADAVVHLAWLIQPGRDESTTHAVNVEGSRRVFEAAAAAGVGTVVYASSVGAYSPGPKDRRVDESWPTEGIDTSFYSRHKAAVERILDSFEAVHPEVLADAYRLALVRPDARGAFNIAADPILDPKGLAETLGARRLPVHAGLARTAAGVSYKLRLQPTEPGWLDMGLGVPIMDVSRAQRDLGWEPRRTAVEAFEELFDGITGIGQTSK